MAAGTTIAYTLVGAGNAANATASGIFTVDSSGKAVSSAIAVPTNAVYGDSGTMTLALANGKATAVVSVTDSTAKPAAGADGSSLTTSADSSTATTIYGTLDSDGTATLNGFDKIASTAGTLYLTDITAADKSVLPSGLKMSGVSQVDINTAGSIGVSASIPFDLTKAGITDVTLLTGVTSSANTNYVKAPATTSVTLNATGGAVNVVGGKDIDLTATGSITVGGTTLAKDPVGSVKAVVNSDTGTGSTVTIDGGKSVSVTTSDSGTVTIGSNYAPTGAVSVTDTGGTGLITVTGGSSATVSATSSSMQTAGNSMVIGGVAGPVTASNASVTAQSVFVKGGTTVGVNTTGGSFTSPNGANGTANTVIVGATSYVPTGAVTVTDTFAGPNQDNISVLGSGSVNINTSANRAPIAILSAGGTGGGTTADSVAFSVVDAGGVTRSFTWNGTRISDGLAITTENITASNYLSTKVSALVSAINNNLNQYGIYANSLTVGSAINIVVSGSISTSVAHPVTAVVTDGGTSNFLLNGVASTVTVNADPRNAKGTAIVVGSSTASQDPTGTVSVVNSMTSGSTTYYGSGNTTINTNGSTTVNVTGGGTTNITDQGATSALTTVNLTGVKGLVTIGSAAATLPITTVGITNSASSTPRGINYYGDNAMPTQVVINNSPTTPLTVNLNNAANSLTSLTDANAGVVTVVNSGTASSNLALNAAAASTINLTNSAVSSSGSATTLTLKTLSDSAAAVTINVTGSSNVNTGNFDFNSATGGAGFTNITAINASTSTGSVTSRLYAGNSTSFTGGNSVLGNTVTVNTGGASVQVAGTYFGGTGSLDTLVLTDKLSDYASSGVGSAFSGFEKLKLGTESSYNPALNQPANGSTKLVSIPSGTYGAAGFANLEVGSFVGGSTTFNGMSTAPGITFSDNPGVQAVVLSLTGTSSDTVADKIKVALNGSSTAYTYAVPLNDIAVNNAAAFTAWLNTTFNGSLFATATGVSDVTIFGGLSGLLITSTKGTDAGTDKTVLTAASGPLSGITFTNAMAKALTLFPNPVTYTLGAVAATAGGGTLPVTVSGPLGSAGSAAQEALPVTLNEANMQTISVSSSSAYANNYPTTDTATAVYNSHLMINDGTSATAANPATAISVAASSGDLWIGYANTGTGYTAAASTNSVKKIDASASAGAVFTYGKVLDVASPTYNSDVSLNGIVENGVALATTGTITIIGGAGRLMASGSTGTGVTETITTGSGGGTILLGQAGQSGAAGTSTINLGASSAKTDVVVVGGVIATGANASNVWVAPLVYNSGTTANIAIVGQRASVSGFSTNPATYDELQYGSTSTAVTVKANGSGSTASGGTYILSNGVITWGATESATNYLSDAVALLGTANNQVVAYTSGSDAIVVATPVQNTAGSGSSTNDSVITLSGAGGVVGFGLLPAANTIVLANNSITNSTDSTTYTLVATSTSSTHDETGYSQVNMSSAGSTTSVASADVTTFNNLAASAVVSVDATSNSYMGSIVTTQLGTNGQKSLLVVLGSAGHTTDLESLTVTGDSAVVVSVAETGTTKLDNLTDTSSSLKTLYVGASNASITPSVTTTSGSTNVVTTSTAGLTAGLAISGTGIPSGAKIASITDGTTFVISSNATASGAVTGTITGVGSLALGTLSTPALSTIDLSSAGNTVTLTDNYAAQTFKLPTASVGVVITASGSGDTVTQTIGASQSGYLKTGSLFTGNNLTISLTGNSGANTFTASGDNAKITLGSGLQTITALGANDTITLYNSSSSAAPYTNNTSANNIAVGAGAKVTLGYGDYGSSTIDVSNSVAASGTLSNGAFNYTTLTNGADGRTMIYIGGSLTTTDFTQVNVATATSLANALDLATANMAAGSTTHNAAAWFQYAGDTYIVAHPETAAAPNGLVATDVIVKLTGLTDLVATGSITGGFVI